MTKLVLGFLSVCFAFAVLTVGCSKPPALQGIEVTPSAPAATPSGQTVQFKAIGAYQQAGGHPVNLKDITNLVTWASSNSSVSTISTDGLATAVSSGTTNITASMGGMVGNATLTVTGESAHDLTSIMVIPSAQSLTSIGESSQFIAIGSYTTGPMTMDITNTVTWQSSDVKVATVNSQGLALANATGSTTITAIGKSNSGASITGTATLSVSNSGGGVPLPQLSIYTVGTGTGTVTSSDGVIDCTTIGGAGCTGNYVVGTTVVLTAVPAAGSTFGGWSSNCTPDNGTTCSIVMNNNEPVGAIFN